MSLTQDLTTVVGRVNNLLCEDLPDDRFVTAFFGVLTPATRTLSFISAGHGPLIQYFREKDEFVELKANAVPLGIMPDLPFSEPDQFAMKRGDMMVLVTDGFFE